MNDEFLNQNFNDDSGDSQENASLSLMAGVAQADELPEADAFELSSKRSVNNLLGQGSLLIIAVAVIAAGTLYAMRLAQGNISDGSVTSEVEARVEQALTKLARPEAMAKDDPLLQQNIQTLFQDTESIVDMFAADPTQQQVPLEYVKKDPFAVKMSKQESVQHTKDDSHLAARRALESQERALMKLKTEAQRMNLQTVMKGRVPVAIIDGEVLRVGQTFGSFQVAEIDDMRVVLKAEGLQFVLTIGGLEDADKKRR